MNIYTELISFDWTFFFILLNMLVLYLIMKRYFFEKIRAFMLTRQEAITDAFQSAEIKQMEAQQTKETYDAQYAQLEHKGRELVKDAKVKADAQAKDIINEAERKAALLITQAETEIERQREKALEDMKQEIAALVIYAAEKVLEKQLDHQEQQVVINKLLQEGGSAQWQN